MSIGAYTSLSARVAEARFRLHARMSARVEARLTQRPARLMHTQVVDRPREHMRRLYSRRLSPLLSRCPRRAAK